MSEEDHWAYRLELRLENSPSVVTIGLAGGLRRWHRWSFDKDLCRRRDRSNRG
ncbi:MAG: hypothetical protein U5P10_08265 [Spirochaetia bacterium]|nr:hypothetical protein [Spirochaetia bacterium]